MPNSIIATLEQRLKNTSNIEQIKQLKVEFLGKQSFVTTELKSLGIITNLDERKKKGEEINHLRRELDILLNEKLSKLEDIILAEKLKNEKLDITLPARIRSQGSIHPVSQAIEELIQVFSKFGFLIKDGPSIENDWYNFTALNIDENHPARQMHDTFYLKNGSLLRTHTSSVEIKTLENESPPLRIIAPGRTYRSDSDITHTPMFHQIEGLVVDNNITMGHLKYVIIEFIKDFFEQPNIEIRFRPSFFSFTEPSAEVDIRMNKNDKWLEVLGCGMTHPNVFKNCNIDPEKYTGFAFGLGVERFAMLKYGIKDLRQFFDSDLRWLKHYSFAAYDIPNIAYGLTK